ncbi:putative ABC transporter ATP-binding protein [Candidatus Magnetaquicoccaceae bacterium FCR-1]|uniref:ABC transporter ATP-binding protein n=1 Tax=Candidatus Magnetaquiglobus chichijimensis TaxID=3141448 RepID=A0ABQ0C6V0_9PROT
MIRLESVAYAVEHAGRYLEILSGVDLEVAPGEIVALTGPSGSGKSTLLALVAGLERPTAGRIRVDGVALAGLSDEELARLRRERMGIVFQDFHLITTLTALENVALPLELARTANARERARRLLEQVGLGERLHHRPLEMSGGEQQRVAIARAFVAHPALILADEPTGNLDLETGSRVMELLFQLTRSWHAAMLLVTHNPELAARAHRHYRLHGGAPQELPMSAPA